MDEFFVSDLTMLGEEEDGVVLGEFANTSKICTDFDNKSQNPKYYVDMLHQFEDAKGTQLPGDIGFQLVSDATALSVDMEDKIVDEYNFIRDRYRLKFPELESLIHQPVEYARLVKMIGHETDMTRVSGLDEVLSPAMIMVLSITASTTIGTPLPQDVLERTLEACDRAIELDSIRTKIANFVESMMSDIAPNLSVLVGSATAAKLTAAAGDVAALAYMPACDVLLLGAPKKTLATTGFSSEVRVGYIKETEVFQNTPPSLRRRVSRVLAGKLSLAARVDFVKGDATGKVGRKYLEEVRKKIEKLQEPPVARIQKSLPVPNDSRMKKKRGGKRLRNQKERYEITRMRQLANRVEFNVPEESSLGDGLGIGHGMLGRDGCGKLRVSATPTKLKISKKNKKLLASYVKRNPVENGSMSFGMTPVQGLELGNVQAADAIQLCSGMQSNYFSKTATFSKI